MAVWIRADISRFISPTKPKRSQSRLMRGHAAIEEHQREVLRVVLAELVVAPEHRAELVDRIRLARPRRSAEREQQAEPFLGERQEDVVLAREIAVDGGRAVLDPLGDLANGDVLVAVADEEVARGIQNGSANSLAVAFLSFFQTQLLYFLVFSAIILLSV